MEKLAYTPVGDNYRETIAKTFIIPVKQNQFNQENLFNYTPAGRAAIAKNTSTAFTEWYAENPLWFQ